MSAKLFVKLLLFLIFCLIECQDWCSLIQPNGQFDGLGTYRHFKYRPIECYSDLMMYSKGGREWKFRITANKSHSEKDLDIELIPDSVGNKTNDSVIYRFGVCNNVPDIDIKDAFYSNCLISRTKNETTVGCFRLEAVSDFMGFKPFWQLKNKFPDYQNILIFKKSPLNGYNRSGLDLIVVNRKNRLFNTVFDFTKGIAEGNRRIRFMEQMESSLFARIDTVIDYHFSVDHCGWLLIFNIDGRPKYCFTEEAKDLSEECKTEENLKSLFDDCFLKKTNILLIVIIVIIAIAVILMIVCTLGYCYYKRKTSESVSTNKTVGTMSFLIGHLGTGSSALSAKQSSTASRRNIKGNDTTKAVPSKSVKNPPKAGPSSQTTGLKPNSPKK